MIAVTFKSFRCITVVSPRFSRLVLPFIKHSSMLARLAVARPRHTALLSSRAMSKIACPPITYIKGEEMTAYCMEVRPATSLQT